MGGLVIETIRAGVQFVPDAAAAFRRANAQVRIEFGRDIDVNSTFRDPATQMAMHLASVAYENGTGPYPGHSYATDPKYSRHVNGTALDSDDWVNARIVAILAENGFIRNQLDVPNEQHHFEWLRSEDRHYGEPIPASASASTLIPEPEEDMSFSLIPLVGGDIVIVSLNTGIRARVGSPDHVGFLARVQKNKNDDQMYGAEVEIAQAYIQGVNPPPTATVDTEALAAALGKIDASQDVEVVKAAVKAALAEATFKAV